MKLFTFNNTKVQIKDHKIDLNIKNLGKKWVKKISVQLGFSSEIKVPQLGSDRLGTFIAWLGLSLKIPAQTHLYYVET